MKADVTVYLQDMLDQIEIIQSELLTMSKEDFLGRPLYQSGMIRCLEVIGEAAKNVPFEYREQHPEVPWRLITGMRDKLAHAYATVDLGDTWNTLVFDIPQLHTQIIHLLEK